MMPRMVALPRWVEVVPRLIVNRYSHFSRIAVVQVLGTTVILFSVVIVRVVDIRIVIEPLPILVSLSAAPNTPVGIFLGLS